MRWCSCVLIAILCAHPLIERTDDPLLMKSVALDDTLKIDRTTHLNNTILRPHSLLEHTDYAACSQFCSAGLVWRPRVTKAAVRRVNCHFEHLSLDKHNSFADTLE